MNGPDEVPSSPRWFDPAQQPEHPDPDSGDAACPPQRPAGWRGELDADAATASTEGQPAEPLDPHEAAAASAREALAGLFSRDLVEPGPGVWPFGARARQRRTRRQQVRQRARQRRQAASDSAELGGQAGLPTRWAPVDPQLNRRVIASLAGTVVVVTAVACWAGSSSTPPPGPPAATAPPPAAPSAASEPQAPPASGDPLGPTNPIPPGGVAAITPPAPHAPPDPAAVAVVPAPTGPPTPTDLSTPEGAGSAWMSRWCPFSWQEPYGSAQQRSRPAMTALGWDTINPDADPTGQVSWQSTVAARESAQCSPPQVNVVPEAPRTADSAVLTLATDRVITGSAATPYVEHVAQTRVVLRGPDGLWRLDAATQGG